MYPVNKPPYTMTYGEFRNYYTLQVGDKVNCYAMYCTSDEQPQLPFFIEGTDIVEATVLKVGDTVVQIKCGLVIANFYGHPHPPGTARALAGRMGIAPIKKLGLALIHKKLLRKAITKRNKIPSEVLESYRTTSFQDDTVDKVRSR